VLTLGVVTSALHGVVLQVVLVTPEELARRDIDRQLGQCGWVIQSPSEMNISAAHGVAMRELPMLPADAGHPLGRYVNEYRRAVLRRRAIEGF
jgi:hypothetical protein